MQGKSVTQKLKFKQNHCIPNRINMSLLTRISVFKLNYRNELNFLMTY